MKQYEIYMKKCFELAKLGEGAVSPNPLVGCVILNTKGVVISTGYHAKYGENHAERDALLKLKNDEAKGCTLIVNLEPCSHYGKTPPCADLIIEKGIKKVVVAMRDVNPIVAGNGIKKLTNAGIEVIENVLQEDAKKLNEVFIKNKKKKKIFVALKTASTLDGKTATRTGSSKWITSEISRNEVKKIRNRYDAILTSSATVIADNPTMQHRIKIILDRNLITDLNSKIYSQGKIYIFHDEKLIPQNKHDNITFVKAPVNEAGLDIEYILKKLYEFKIMSVLVESGGRLNGSFLRFADKVYHFIAPKILCDNSSKSCFDGKNILEINDCMQFKFDEIKKFGSDILLTYYRI